MENDFNFDFDKKLNSIGADIIREEEEKGE